MKNTGVKNISYFLNEINNKNTEGLISYDEIMEQVLKAEREFDDIQQIKISKQLYQSEHELNQQYDDMSTMAAIELDYDTNYIKKDLERIAAYYGISKRKKRKCDLIQDIIIYENTTANFEKVFTRKKLWGYMTEIMEDSYLKQFLILD